MWDSDLEPAAADGAVQTCAFGSGQLPTLPGQYDRTKVGFVANIQTPLSGKYKVVNKRGSFSLNSLCVYSFIQSYIQF